MSSAATGTDLEMTKLSQSENDKYHLLLICEIWKNDTNDLVYETETDYKLWKQTYGYQRGKVEGRINEEFWINIYTVLYVKQVINKDLLYSTGTLLNVL